MDAEFLYRVVVPTALACFFAASLTLVAYLMTEQPWRRRNEPANEFDPTKPYPCRGTCETCNAFDGNDYDGICRRNSPGPDGWPLVLSVDWCHEHEPAPQSETLVDLD